MMVMMVGLSQPSSSRGCCEAADVVGILLLFNLPCESFGYLPTVCRSEGN